MDSPTATTATPSYSSFVCNDDDNEISSTSSTHKLPTEENNRRNYRKKIKLNNGRGKFNTDESESPNIIRETCSIKKPQDMINFACHHIQNTKNLQLLEWSEAVLIQLCQLHDECDFEDNSWSMIINFITENEWNMAVSHNIRENVDSRVTLSQIIKYNHKFKVLHYKLNENCAFVKVPTINYNILKKYKFNNTIKATSGFELLPIKVRKRQNESTQ